MILPATFPHPPLLAVALAAATTDEALRLLEDCAGQADLAELRLDLMGEYDLLRLLRQAALPLIITNRPSREGGHFNGSEAQRLDTLAEAITLGAAYVDIESDAVAHFVERLGGGWPPAQGSHAPAPGLIVSQHVFEGMPPDLPRRHAALAGATAAAIPKVVGMALCAGHAAAVLRLLEQATVPTIAIAMGAAGLPSRVLALRYPAALLTFAAPPRWGAGPTAPGQVTLDAMHDVFFCRSIGPATHPFGLLCRALDLPLVAHYNRLLRQRANAVCVPLVMAPSETPGDVVAAYTPLGLRGYAVAPDASPLAHANAGTNFMVGYGAPAQQVAALLEGLQDA